ncbi:MAG: hypothetical protein BM557_05250 [Flavobacterium sp. MedPE-SWcel]|nr:MAG: hypothetical protein BM557_05250 [Flavobacterium sp. MedPE-SWcel]
MTVLCTLLYFNTSAQVYLHDFGTTTVTGHPYTAAPTVIDTDIINSTWSNNIGLWTSTTGQTGQGLVHANAITGATMTLTFDVATGKQLDITSFNFWRNRSATGPQNWEMTINGIIVGNGAVPMPGLEIGETNVLNPITELTGTVTIVLTLNNSLGAGGTFTLDDFEINGTISEPCTPPVITSIAPASGPAETIVTINGNGFEAGAGTTAVQFNGVNATDFEIVSDTEIKATVPATATTGAITVTTDDCEADTTSFTLLSSDCPDAGGDDVYISELYDHTPGSYGAIELYNPTANTITFNDQYILERYGDVGGATASYTLTLPGSIAPFSTYIVRSYGTGVMGCSVAFDAEVGQGINANDEFKIKKNNIIIDIARAPNNTGYTVIRNADAIAPSTTYNNSDWSFTSNDCSDLGTHNGLVSSTITTQPTDYVITCDTAGSASFNLEISNPTGFTFQWKTLDASGNWVDIVDNTQFSGSTTSTLTVNPEGIDFDLAQFYCEIESVTCTLISDAVQLIITPLPVATTTITQPTCDNPNGIIEVTSPLGAVLQYSINGVDFQFDTTFTVTEGTYNVTVQNADGCTSVTPDITIEAVIDAPAVATTTLTQPTCTSPDGTIVITAPTGAGLEYSINGVDFQSETTFTITEGTYNITVRNADGCTSITDDIIINEVPDAPAVATTAITQPTCTNPDGTIGITAPTGAGLEYSINGVDFQSETTFTVAAGTYNVTVINTDGCTSITDDIVINTVAEAPAIATTTITQPTCTTPNGTIVITAPTGAGLEYSINGVDFQSETTFTVTEGTYNVTVRNADGCTSITTDIAINATPNTPVTATTTVTQPSCTNSNGTITVTAPTGAGLEYSINGIDFQAATTFTVTDGTYNVTVRNASGCTSLTSDIIINEIPDAPIATGIQDCINTTFGRNSVLEALAIDGSFDSNTATYEWTNTNTSEVVGNNDSIFNLTQYTINNNITEADYPLNFTVTITTIEGCITTHNFVVETIFCTIPRGISPNNDGKNDNFDLVGLNVKRVVIFNRYGKEVYSKNNYQNEWEGQTDNGDELPTGTYYYVVETSNNSQTGWVYINR